MMHQTKICFAPIAHLPNNRNSHLWFANLSKWLLWGKFGPMLCKYWVLKEHVVPSIITLVTPLDKVFNFLINILEPLVIIWFIFHNSWWLLSMRFKVVEVDTIWLRFRVMVSKVLIWFNWHGFYLLTFLHIIHCNKTYKKIK